MSPPKFKRGDAHPSDARKVFYQYQGEREVWTTPERLQHIRAAMTANALATTAKRLRSGLVQNAKYNKKRHEIETRLKQGKSETYICTLCRVPLSLVLAIKNELAQQPA